MTRRSRGLIILNLWVLLLMFNSLGLNTLRRYARKPLQPLPTEVAVQIYSASKLSHFDYCGPVWDCMSGYLSDKLQKLQNRTPRVITKSPFDASSSLLLAMRKWEKLSFRRKKKTQKALIMYETLNELAQTIYNVFLLNATLMNIT